MRITLFLISIVLMCNIAFGAAADMAVTVAGAGDGSGTGVDGVTLEWDNAMSLAQWEADVEATAEPGDRYFVAGGTYTLTGTFSAQQDGDAVTGPIIVIGVKAGTTAEPPTSADWAYTTDRPLIAAGANQFTFDNYWHIRNLRLETTHTTGFDMDQYNIVWNCKSENSEAGNANEDALSTGSTDTLFINCEGISGIGDGADLTSRSYMINCYLHDSNVGIDCISQAILIGNVIEDCTTYGILFGTNSYGGGIISNSIIHNCATGLACGGANYNYMFLNNMIDANSTSDANWTTASPSNYWDYNNWHGGVAPTNVTKGDNATAISPTFGGEGSGDYTQTNSALDDLGFPYANFAGTSTTPYVEQGTAMLEETGGGTTEDVFGWVD